MPTEMFVDIDTGEVFYLNSPLAAGFMSDMTDPGTMQRASHVEPVRPVDRFAFHFLRAIFGENGRVGNSTRRFPGPWRVNLAPVGGPILPQTFTDRNEAIAAEIAYLNDHPELWVR